MIQVDVRYVRKAGPAIRRVFEVGLTRLRNQRHAVLHRGRKVDRPEMAKALHLAKVTGATPVITKLDRLSRNTAYLPALRDSGVRFVAVDMAEANDLAVGIMALAARAEREAIFQRTKGSLAVAKSRGVKLGNPNGQKASGGPGKLE